MLEQFTIHNLFKIDKNEFLTKDPHLSSLLGMKYVYDFPFTQTLPVETAGIYVVTGGRQIGKSTLLKQIIKKLLLQRVDPKQIFYIPCDLFEHFTQLTALLDEIENLIDKEKFFYLFFDEMTYVEGWERAIKFFADKGFFKKGSLSITGSDTILLKQAMVLLPGRRGMASVQDYHLSPLSFAETVGLYNTVLQDQLYNLKSSFMKSGSLNNELTGVLAGADFKALAQLWQGYLMTGGFLTAINRLALSQNISQATFQTYLQWIAGDLVKRGKSLIVAQEIYSALLNCLGSQVTWHSLTTHLSTDSHQIVSDYIDLLDRMDVVLVHQAFVEDKKAAAPKKAKKVFFRDPFIFHALHGYCGQKTSFFDLAQNTLAVPGKMHDALHEQTLVALAHRGQRSFYIKAEGEVDLVILRDRKFVPIEIKNTAHLRTNELKQITKYKNGIIAANVEEMGYFGDQVVCPIPLMGFLLG